MKVKKILIFGVLAFVLLVLYLYLIWTGFASYRLNTTSIFGYLDFQNNWRAMEDFVSFKTPFQDYFFEYGSFFLFLQSGVYLLFGRGFSALLISRYLYLPLLSTLLSYVIAVNVLKKKYLALVCLIFLILFGTNYDFTSVRHLVAELSLSFLILFFWYKKQKYLFLSGLVAGFAVLTALEYGLALNVAIFIIFVLSLFSEVKLKNYFFNRFILGQLLILFPYFFWLYLKGALVNFYEFTYGYMRVFYSVSPCSSGSFPRLEDIGLIKPVSKLLIFELPVEFLQNVNLYLVFAVFAVSSIVLVILSLKRKKIITSHLVELSLIVYGLLIFVRTLDTPCLGYFVYGLVPFFLLLVIYLEKILNLSLQSKKPWFRNLPYLFVLFIFGWFILTENTGHVVEYWGKKTVKPEIKDAPALELYPPAGWFIDKPIADGYKEAVDYIDSNSDISDFLFVYPWGPYNNLTHRRPPNSISNAFHYVTDQKFVDRTKRELETKKPKLVVINIYNNLGMVHYGKIRGDVPRYFSLGTVEGPVFSGTGNDVEKYILENYETVFHNNIAIIMKPRNESINIKQDIQTVYSATDWQKENINLNNMSNKDQNGAFTVTDKNASWTVTFNQPIEATDIAVKLKLDDSLLTRHFSRYFLNSSVTVVGEEKPRLASELATKDWQTIKIPFVKAEKISSVKIEIGKNSGLMWWLNPNQIDIKSVEFFKQ
jgi:hypothetical protein